MELKKDEIEKLRESLGEETVQKLELMEQNEALVKENNMLRESCENFAEVETNLRRIIKKLEDARAKLVENLEALTRECSSAEALKLFVNLSTYNNALKAIELYKEKVWGGV